MKRKYVGFSVMLAGFLVLPSSARETAHVEWDPDITKQMVGFSLKHINRINYILARIVHNFGRSLTAEEIEAVYAIGDGGQAQQIFDTFYGLLEKSGPGNEAFFNFLAMVKVAQHPTEYKNWKPLVEQNEDVKALQKEYKDYLEYVMDVRGRVQQGIAYKLMQRNKNMKKMIETAQSYGGRTEAAKKFFDEKKAEISNYLEPLGIDIDAEIAKKKDFLYDMATREIEQLPAGSSFQRNYVAYYEMLQEHMKQLRAHHGKVTAALRLMGIDIEAVLKKRARIGPDGQVDQPWDGTVPGTFGVHNVRVDVRNNSVVVLPYPDQLAIHYTWKPSRTIPDTAALIYQWEHGAFPDIRAIQMAYLVRQAGELSTQAKFKDFATRVFADLLRRYEKTDMTDVISSPNWNHPLTDELRLANNGSFCLPGALKAMGPFREKVQGRHPFASPVGKVVELGFKASERPPYPKRMRSLKERRATLNGEIFSSKTFPLYQPPPTLHLAIDAHPGVECAIYHTGGQGFSRMKARERQPVFTGLGDTPDGGVLIPDYTVGATSELNDDVHLIIHPHPAVASERKKPFKWHACFISPLDYDADSFKRTVSGSQVHWTGSFVSPIWQKPGDVPISARFFIFRRKKNPAGKERERWRSLHPMGLYVRHPDQEQADYPFSNIFDVRSNAGFATFTYRDHKIGTEAQYEYHIKQGCALARPPQPPPDERPPTKFEVLAPISKWTHKLMMTIKLTHPEDKKSDQPYLVLARFGNQVRYLYPENVETYFPPDVAELDKLGVKPWRPGNYFRLDVAHINQFPRDIELTAVFEDGRTESETVAVEYGGDLATWYQAGGNPETVPQAGTHPDLVRLPMARENYDKSLAAYKTAMAQENKALITEAELDLIKFAGSLLAREPDAERAKEIWDFTRKLRPSYNRDILGRLLVGRANGCADSCLDPDSALEALRYGRQENMLYKNGLPHFAVARAMITMKNDVETARRIFAWYLEDRKKLFSDNPTKLKKALLLEKAGIAVPLKPIQP